MQAGEDEVVNCTAISKAHLVFRGVDIDIDLRRIQLEVKHKGGVASMIQHIAISLLYSMGDQPVTNDPSVNKKVL